jgi:hypothetical protein
MYETTTKNFAFTIMMSNQKCFFILLAGNIEYELTGSHWEGSSCCSVDNQFNEAIFGGFKFCPLSIVLIVVYQLFQSQKIENSQKWPGGDQPFKSY